MPLDLAWQAPLECPGRDVVLARVRALLGAKTWKSATLHAKADIQRSGDGFELELLIDEGGKGGERKVWARQCDELGSAAAIALALLLTSSGEEAHPANTAASSDAGATASTALPENDPPAAPRTPTNPPAGAGTALTPNRGRRPWHLLLAAPQLAVGIGPLPKPLLGVGAGVGVEGGRWSLRLFGQWYGTRAIAAPVEPYGAYVKRAAAGLWGCSELSHGALNLSPCLEASVAHLRATGYGPFLKSATQSETSLGVGVGAIGRIRAARWLALMVGVGAQLELSRPVILLTTVGRVRQLMPVSGIVQLGPEWIF